MYKTINSYNLTTVLLVVICVSFLSGCLSGNSSNTETNDSLKNDSLKAYTPSINNEVNSETQSETLNLQMNAFEKSIIEATEGGIYIVQTEQGFDYIKTDFDYDGLDDAIALLTFKPNPNNYDFESTVHIALFTGAGDGILLEYGYSGDLGGESIQYKGNKKLTWENETLTYTHQSMRNHIEIDIKIVDVKTKLIDKISICYYNSTSSCEDLFIASEKDTVNLNELNAEFLDSLISK